MSAPSVSQVMFTVFELTNGVVDGIVTVGALNLEAEAHSLSFIVPPVKRLYEDVTIMKP